MPTLTSSTSAASASRALETVASPNASQASRLMSPRPSSADLDQPSRRFEEPKSFRQRLQEVKHASQRSEAERSERGRDDSPRAEERPDADSTDRSSSRASRSGRQTGVKAKGKGGRASARPEPERAADDPSATADEAGASEPSTLDQQTELDDAGENGCKEEKHGPRDAADADKPAGRCSVNLPNPATPQPSQAPADAATDSSAPADTLNGKPQATEAVGPAAGVAQSSTATGAGESDGVAANPAAAGNDSENSQGETTPTAGSVSARAGGRAAPGRRSSSPLQGARPGPRPTESDGDVASAAGTRLPPPPQVNALADRAAFMDAFTDAFGGGDAGDSEEPASLATAATQLTPIAPLAVETWKSPAAANENAASKPADGPPQPISEPDFAAANHARIAGSVKGELLPNGGTMHLRLDPPELGSLQVSLHLKDGVVTASFQTQNDEAARLLSHSLTDLRNSLESHGIAVDKIHVQQAPREETGGGQSSSDRQGPATQQQENRREQQRKDMVQRLWDRLAGKEPLDLVA